MKKQNLWSTLSVYVFFVGVFQRHVSCTSENTKKCCSLIKNISVYIDIPNSYEFEDNTFCKHTLTNKTRTNKFIETLELLNSCNYFRIFAAVAKDGTFEET